MADRAAALGFDADLEARVVYEVHHRKTEGVAEVDEAGHLLAPVGCEAAAVEVRVVGDDSDREAIEAAEARDERLPPARSDLEE